MSPSKIIGIRPPQQPAWTRSTFRVVEGSQIGSENGAHRPLTHPRSRLSAMDSALPCPYVLL
jgi:hypothetical protein